MLVVFDIDGTVADIDHRLHHIKSKPKNWAAFDAAAKNDVVIKATRNLYFSLLYDSGHDLVFATGRNERNRKQTESWLAANGFKGYVKLYMRNATDFRQDSLVKQDMLNLIIAEFGKKPDLVFEDRTRVVKMWRDNGIFVLDCNQTGEIY
jgi:hypothetical protein